MADHQTSALRHYTPEEIHALSQPGLEALLLTIEDVPRPTADHDTLFIAVTKPIRAALRKRRREENTSQVPDGTTVVEVPEEVAGTPEPQFGKVKKMEGFQPPHAMDNEEFQAVLSKAAAAAPCARSRASAVFDTALRTPSPRAWSQVSTTASCWR